MMAHQNPPYLAFCTPRQKIIKLNEIYKPNVNHVPCNKIVIKYSYPGELLHNIGTL